MTLEEQKRAWLADAVRAGLRGQLNPQAVSEAYHIIYTAFGDEWLRKQEQKANCRAYGFMAGHALMRSLQSGQPNTVTNIVELAQYLKAFGKVDTMPEVLARLRDSDLYEDCLFELAIAYRFDLIGATIMFSPPTARGLADLKVSIDNNRWICECTRQHLPGDQSKRLSMRDNLLHLIMKKIRVSGVSATIKAIVKPNAPADAFVRAADVVGELLTKLKERRWVCHTLEDKELSIIVKESSDAEEPNPALTGEWAGSYRDLENHPWEVVIDESRIHQDRVVDIKNGVPISEIPTKKLGRIFIQTNPQYGGIEAGILKKVKRKLSQSRNAAASACPRLIFVETLGVLEELNWKELSTGIAGLFDQHEHFAGIFLMNRRYSSEKNRYAYGLYLLSNAKHGLAFPPSIFKKLKAVEREHQIY